jgi:hypothetical protein
MKFPRREIVASGAFTLEKAVVAGGGSAKQGASLGEHGTTGQSIAGIKSNGGQFSLYSGFWTPEELAPTAASVNVGGSIKTAAGKGIRNVKINRTFSEWRDTHSSFGRRRLLSIRRYSGGRDLHFQRVSQTLCFHTADASYSDTEDTQELILFGESIKNPKKQF